MTELPQSPEISTEPGAENRPKSARPKWFVPAAIVGGVILVGGIVGIVYAVAGSKPSPSAAASSYFDALVDGDATEALSHVEGIADADQTLLSDEVYSAATDRISGYSVTEETVKDDTATVSVEVEQAGETFTQKVALEKKGDAWMLDAASVPTVMVSVAGPEGLAITANGVTLDAPPTEAAPVLPGTYEFSAGEASGNVSIEPVTQAVTLANAGEAIDVELTAQLSEQGLAAAKAAYDVHLAACLAQNVLVPPSCGYGVRQDAAIYSNIRWSEVAHPEVSFSSWNADKGFWDVVLVASGHLRFDSDYTEGDESGTALDDITDYVPKGGVVFDADGVATYVSTYIPAA